MRRSTDDLATLREVSRRIAKPAHRIIHLCEGRVVVPRVDSAGRGTMRKFDRENVFRVLLGLELQDAGVAIPRLRRVMQTLDRFMALPEIKRVRERLLKSQDLVELVFRLGDDANPVLIVLQPPDHVTLVTPKFSTPTRPEITIDLTTSSRFIFQRGVSTVANLTTYAHAVR